MQNLSGGELQRVAMALCLGKPADVYLVDEPSAYLDSEQRLVAAKVIKRFILHAKKTGFIVEHDFIMATYLADKVRISIMERKIKIIHLLLKRKVASTAVKSSAFFLNIKSRLTCLFYVP